MGRRRSSGVTLSDLVELSFESQNAALTIGAMGYVFISGIPKRILEALFPSQDVRSAVEQGQMYDAMITNGIGGGLIGMLPLLRFVGLALLFFAGCALLKSGRDPSYLRSIKSSRINNFAGVAFILIAIVSLLNNGLFTKPAEVSAAAAAQHTRGVVEQDMVPATQQTITSGRVAGAADLPPANLAPDRPFPANGRIERTLPLAGQIARMQVKNVSDQNMIVLWFFNMGEGEKEAARMYVAAGQSAYIDIPTFHYRMASFTAPTSLGLDRGFGPNAHMNDLGFVDLRTPAPAYSSAPTYQYGGFGRLTFFSPGKLLTSR